MMKSVFFIAGLILLYTSCTDDPVSSKDKTSFTPLAIGDITQLISIRDSSTILIKIIGTTFRSDNQSVFIAQWQYGKSSYDTSYYFIKDGYYIATNLEPVTEDSTMLAVNPFWEQRLAKSDPEDGDRWIHTPGQADTTWWHAYTIPTLEVPAGKFDEVFGFNLGGFLTTFYGKDVGWLGSGLSFQAGYRLDFVCTYKKVSGRVYGALMPAKNPTDIIVVKQKIELIFGLQRKPPKIQMWIDGQFSR